jgi:protein AroM
MQLGVVTIGQSPRLDLLDPFRAALGSVADIREAGALDGLSDAAVRDLTPEPNETPLVTRLASGETVVIAKERILETLQCRIDALVSDGAALVVVLCTGPFPRFPAPVPILLPDPILRHLVEGILPDGKLGIVAPIAGQYPMMARKWCGYDLTLRAVDPYGPVAAMGEAVANLTDCQLIILDCMGFSPAHAAIARAACPRPVLLAQDVLARTVAMLAGTG